MSEANKAPADFEHVKSPAEASNLLKEGAKTFASTMVWSKDQIISFQTHLTLISSVESVVYVWVPKDLDPGQFMDEMAKRSQTECYFSVSLSRANIFFRAKFLGYDHAGLKFALPEKIFKVQRRKDVRLPILDGHVLRLTFQDPLFPENTTSKKLLDISAGGAAMLIDENEGPLYQVGTILTQCSLTLNGKKLVFEAEVRHLRPMPETAQKKGIKMGVQFQKLNAAEIQHIASYVFEESRKYFTRFI